MKAASSRMWVGFTLLMNYLPRQACLRESWVKDEPPSHRSFAWVVYLNNIILFLIYFLFLYKLSFLNAVNLQPC